MGENLTTLIVADDDVEAALWDFDDLKSSGVRVGRTADFEVAVVQRTEESSELRATTVKANEQGTWLGAGLGLAAGLLILPVLPVAIVGAGMGFPIGNVVDQVEGFRHAHHMPEVIRRIDESTIDLLVIGDTATTEELAGVALARDRCVMVPLAKVDVDALQHELRDANISFKL